MNMLAMDHDGAPGSPEERTGTTPTKDIYKEIDVLEWLRQQASKIEEEDFRIDTDLKNSWQQRRYHYVDEGYGFQYGTEWVALSTVESAHGNDFENIVCEANYYAYFLRQALWQIAGAQPGYRARFPTDANSDLAASTTSELLIKAIQAREWGPVKRQDAGTNVIICGTFVVGAKWNKDGGCKMKRPEYKEEEVVLPALYGCKHCETFSEQDETLCPDCNEPMETVEQERRERHQKKIGEKDEYCGFPEIEVPDPVQFKGDFRARSVAETMYWRRLRKVPEGLITTTYPHAIAKSSEVRNAALDIMQREQDSPGGVANLNLMSLPMVTTQREFGQYYLHPAAYDRLKSDADLELMNGKVLKKGDMLRAFAPKGLYFAISGNEVLDICAAQKEEEWFIGHCVRVPYRLWGHTFAEALRRQQRNLDRLLTIATQNAWYNAAPTTLIDSTYIDKSDITGDPNNIVDVRGAAAENKPVTNFFARVPGTGVDNQTPLLVDFWRETQRQSAAGFTPSGSPGANPQTAEAARIMQATAASSLTPMMDEMNETMIAVFRRCLKMIQEKWDDDAYIGICGGLTPEQIEAFRAADLDRLEITVDPASRMPRTEYEKQQSLLAFTQSFLGPNAQFYSADQLEMYAREMGVPLKTILDIPDRDEARSRIETLRAGSVELIKQGLMNRPEALASMLELLKPIPHVDGHGVFVEIYSKYLKTPEGRILPPLAREALIAAVAMHKEAAMAEMIAEQQAMAAAQAAGQAVATPAPEPEPGPSVDSQPVTPEENEQLQEQPAEPQGMEVPMGGPLPAEPAPEMAAEKPPVM